MIKLVVRHSTRSTFKVNLNENGSIECSDNMNLHFPKAITVSGGLNAIHAIGPRINICCCPVTKKYGKYFSSFSNFL